MYRTILADPPWDMKMLGSMLAAKRKMRSARHCYPTMSIDEIKALPVGEYAENGCHLWLWAVNQLLEEAFQVMRAWGFKYHNLITWTRPSGTGNYFVTRTQHILFGYRGKCIFNRERYIPNVYEWPVPSKHSRKPEGSYRLIESISDEPRLELFARPMTPLFQRRPGWDQWGNEMSPDIDLVA